MHLDHVFMPTGRVAEELAALVLAPVRLLTRAEKGETSCKSRGHWNHDWMRELLTVCSCGFVMRRVGGKACYNTRKYAP